MAGEYQALAQAGTRGLLSTLPYRAHRAGSRAAARSARPRGCTGPDTNSADSMSAAASRSTPCGDGLGWWAGRRDGRSSTGGRKVVQQACAMQPGGARGVCAIQRAEPWLRHSGLCIASNLIHPIYRQPTSFALVKSSAEPSPAAHLQGGALMQACACSSASRLADASPMAAASAPAGQERAAAPHSWLQACTAWPWHGSAQQPPLRRPSQPIPGPAQLPQARTLQRGRLLGRRADAAGGTAPAVLAALPLHVHRVAVALALQVTRAWVGAGARQQRPPAGAEARSSAATRPAAARQHPHPLLAHAAAGALHTLVVQCGHCGWRLKQRRSARGPWSAFCVPASAVSLPSGGSGWASGRRAIRRAWY